jgi:hypothetical protein
MALEMALRRMRAEGITVHGFRSAFRDWCGEETNFPRLPMSPAMPSKSAASHGAWAQYLESGADSNVVRLAR